LSDEKDSKLQQISTTVAALVASAPLLGGDKWGAAFGLAGVGLASLIENIRTRKLDDMVHDILADGRVRERFDETVKADEFLALYVRARDTATKSEKDEKLRYIRNFLIHAVTKPTSTDPDKERYLRLIDELTLSEHEHFIAFLRNVVPSSGAATLEDWLKKPATAGGAISTYASRALGVPNRTSSAELNDFMGDLVVAFRHLDSVGLLNGVEFPRPAKTSTTFRATASLRSSCALSWIRSERRHRASDGLTVQPLSCSNRTRE
jgi:hypothetical protein